MPIPLIIAGGAAIGAGIAAAKAAPAISRTKQEKSNKERIRELEAMGSAMGLTGAEKANMMAGFANELEGTQAAGERQAAAALANSTSQGSGAALRTAGQAMTQRADAGRAALVNVANANAARRTELEQELEDRLGFQSQARKARIEGITSIATGAVKGGMAAAGPAALLGAAGGAKTAPPAAPAVAPTTPAAAKVPTRAQRIAALPPDQLEALRKLMIERGLDVSELPPAAAGVN